jgi:ribosomal protein S18 acetylase RimI-like enzyme
LYSSTTRKPDPGMEAAWDAARIPDSSNPSHKALLMGHVIATITTAGAVTDASMEISPSFAAHQASAEPSGTTMPATDEPSAALMVDATARPAQPLIPQFRNPNEPGHHPEGRTITIHSVCILPQFQRMGLGRVMFQSYLQRMGSSGIADRAALLAHGNLVAWYVGVFGFKDYGESNVKFGVPEGGPRWRNLVSRGWLQIRLPVTDY